MTAATAFPHHAVPDGAVFAPHHLWTGLLLVLLALLVVWDDDPLREPWGLLAALLATGFCFGLTWPYYPRAGAVGSLLGVTVALVSLTLWPAFALVARQLELIESPPTFWTERRLAPAWFGAVVGTLIAADDVLEHALGWTTPLDWAWKNGGVQLLNRSMDWLVGVPA